MSLRIIRTIIKYEYLTRVKKKSFFLTTFLVPILFAVVASFPALILFFNKSKVQKIAVKDDSGIVAPLLKESKKVQCFDYSSSSLDSLKNNLEAIGVDVLLYISALDKEKKDLSAESYSSKPLGLEISDEIKAIINSAVKNYRIQSYDIQNLKIIMESVDCDISLKTYILDLEGKEQASKSEIYFVLSMVFATIIYFFISLFSGMVMSSVIEEKSSRVIEILMSSVKSFELLFGKLIGIALVAITQFLLWIVLTFTIITGVSSFFSKGISENMANVEETTKILSSSGALTSSTLPSSELLQRLNSKKYGEELNLFSGIFKNLNFLHYFLCFLGYFILGYLLYASLFAAISSSVENEADTQQLAFPLTIPLLVGFLIAFVAFKTPDSSLVWWGSMIPFTSPIVMMSRLPFGVPTWEILLSLFFLLITFILCAWISARIYRVGVLMFGKKSSLKDLWKWLKSK